MSTFFTVEEMRCKDKTRTPYPAEWEETRLVELFETLDEIRFAWGSPLTVVSGYRTAAYNAKLSKLSVGVAKNSQHVEGRAVDLAPTNPTSDRVEALWNLVRSLWHHGKLEGMGGLGIYPRWIHVDARAHAPGHLTQWSGRKHGSER